MSLEDPFLIVQNEVFDALHKLRNNFTRWTELQSNPSQLSREDYSAFVTELKNGLKSIQWDLDELEESLENSERATTLDGTELTKRKSFIDKTRDEIKSMTEQLTKGNNIFKKVDYTINFGSQQLPKQTKYYRLINEPDSSANTKQVFDDDESHKSPYVPNHSITLDEADHTINVINARPNKLEGIRRLWLNIDDKQKVIAGFTGTAIIVLLVFFFW
ncbi:Syntaxin-6 [Dermatophagoides farinae]|uniref:Syntaxin-6 n=1 Tax=Dermatophagoides farinae TaxID=6954 RepID=A0A922L5G3_DERFA|nr:syntaxin-61-like [Dermatophagoides farinae]XP_046914148.1 syntaxin-61-like [Dermatophagoides farinae]KAH7636969.1 syntaxin-6-like protein [Dermatophagoides farinae]KAH9510713.1 Syntaxin-6 [Dermatophagoides farinae]